MSGQEKKARQWLDASKLIDGKGEAVKGAYAKHLGSLLRRAVEAERAACLAVGKAVWDAKNNHELREVDTPEAAILMFENRIRERGDPVAVAERKAMQGERP